MKKRSTKQHQMIDREVGKRLRVIRNARGFSQECLAEKLGLTFQQVQKYESGKNRISASRIWDICKVVEKPINYFFDGLDDIPSNEEPPKRIDLEMMRVFQGLNPEVKNSVLRMLKHMPREETATLRIPLAAE